MPQKKDKERKDERGDVVVHANRHLSPFKRCSFLTLLAGASSYQLAARFRWSAALSLLAAGVCSCGMQWLSNGQQIKDHPHPQ